MNNRNGNTLILGGTGKTGRRVADRLRDRGMRVRIASRSGAAHFDWNDQASWAPSVPTRLPLSTSRKL